MYIGGIEKALKNKTSEQHSPYERFKKKRQLNKIARKTTSFVFSPSL